VLEGVLWLKTRALAAIRGADRLGRRLVGIATLVLIMPGSKFVDSRRPPLPAA
jgi:hypothetical protein